MAAYQIISDGSCDLGAARTSQRNIQIVPYYISLDGEKFYKEIEELDIRELYRQMVENPRVFPKTSLPTVTDYGEVFEKNAAAGFDMICLCLSSKFSGSYNSALNAASLVSERYPERKITVIDSEMATALQGLLVLEAARMRDDDVPYDEAVRKIQNLRRSGRIFFSVGSMDYLIHGGRVGKLKGLAAATLGVKPLICLKEGELFPQGMTRNRKKAFVRITQLAREYFETSGENPQEYIFATGYGYDYNECVQFKDVLLPDMKNYVQIEDIEIYQIGATISVHTGPYPLGMGFLKRYEYVEDLQ